MSSNSLIPVWTGVVLLSTILLMGKVCGAQTDPCNPDPCATIPNAVADTCIPIGGSCSAAGDYVCDCDEGFSWQGITHTCEAVGVPPPPTYVYCGNCVWVSCCEGESVEMYWDPAPRATYYEVGWSCSGGSLEIYNMGYKTYLDDMIIETHLGQACGGFVTYLGVRACNATYGCSAWSDVPSNEVPSFCIGGCCTW
jgi:hypothetical protein